MPKSLRAAEPTVELDVYNACNTGHQRAENRLSSSTAWRDSRTAKLNIQLADATHNGQASGQQRIHDSVGAGSLDFGTDCRLPNGGWAKGSPDSQCQTAGDRQTGLSEFWRAGKPICAMEKKRVVIAKKATEAKKRVRLGSESSDHDEFGRADKAKRRATATPLPKQIFQYLTFWVNGSTYPTISDHKLKRLVMQHGGSLALGLTSRRVTHVIVGRPSSEDGAENRSALAAGKLQKEILSGLTGRNGISSGIHFVSAEWVLECVEKGKRVSERGQASNGSVCVGLAHGQSSIINTVQQ